MAESNGGTKWQVYVAIASLAVVLIGGLIALNVQVANTAYSAATNQGAISVMQGRLDRIEERSSELHTMHAQMEIKLTEIETQFCASDIIRNLMHANELRVMAVLWAKAFPQQRIPTDNSYYPMVCNRQPDARPK